MFTCKFKLGILVATPGALALLAEHYTLPEDLLDRHVVGDWGDLDAEDLQRNESALQDGSRLFSAYKLTDDAKVWIITEAEDDKGKRSATTLLLPEEY